jgi:hypothetical protein
MVTVYHHTKVNGFAKGRRHVKRNYFFHVAIELHPFKVVKAVWSMSGYVGSKMVMSYASV